MYSSCFCICLGPKVSVASSWEREDKCEVGESKRKLKPTFVSHQDSCCSDWSHIENFVGLSTSQSLQLRRYMWPAEELVHSTMEFHTNVVQDSEIVKKICGSWRICRPSCCPAQKMQTRRFVTKQGNCNSTSPTFLFLLHSALLFLL